MSYKNTANQFGLSNTFGQGESGISIALADDRYINEDEGYKKKEIDEFCEGFLDKLKLKANINDTIILESGKARDPIDMNNKRIVNVSTPITNNDAMTKGYADSKFVRLDGTSQMTGELDMFNRKIINLLDPVVNTDAATKNYVDTLIKTVTNMRTGGVKLHTGYIPSFSSKAKYETHGFNVVTSGYSTMNTTGWNVLFDGEWTTDETTNYWIEIQLPETIRIWKFAIRGNAYPRPIGNQPESIVLKGGIKGSSIYTDIFSTLNADLEPGLIKYFEVTSGRKYSVYRLHCNTSTTSSRSSRLSYIQLYPIEDIHS